MKYFRGVANFKIKNFESAEQDLKFARNKMKKLWGKDSSIINAIDMYSNEMQEI